jgi:chemotaxis protein MotB
MGKTKIKKLNTVYKNLVISNPLMKTKRNNSMKSTLRFIISTTAILILSGCVSTKKYQSLQSDNKTLQAKNDALYLDNVNCQNSLASANTRIAGLQDQLTAERSNLAALQSALDKCLTSAGQGNVNISKLVDEINASNKYIQALIASKNKRLSEYGIDE